MELQLYTVLILALDLGYCQCHALLPHTQPISHPHTHYTANNVAACQELKHDFPTVQPVA